MLHAVLKLALNITAYMEATTGSTENCDEKYGGPRVVHE
jgi:hypothetical protein